MTEPSLTMAAVASRGATAARHGETKGVTDPELLLGDDPDLANVFADMAAWQLAHPCDCEALCECEGGNS